MLDDIKYKVFEDHTNKSSLYTMITRLINVFYIIYNEN